MSGNDVFIVEKILAHRMIHGKLKYLLKWKGYPDSDNTWEPEENLLDANMLKEYKRRNGILDEAESRQVVDPCNNFDSEDGSESQVVVKDEVINDPFSLPCTKTRYGFDRGLEAETILGATNEFGEIMFLVKWRGTEDSDLVYASEANVKCPQLVINFYEKHVSWEEDEDEQSASTK